MKSISHKLLLIALLIFFTDFLRVEICYGQDSGRSAYEGSYLYITDASGRDYPHNGTPSWGDDDALTNGIAHDDANWYISSLSTDLLGFPGGSWTIWRIPVSEPLDQDFSGNASVSTVHLADVPALKEKRYDHAGDLDCFYHDGIYYLVVPLTSSPQVDDRGVPIPGSSHPPSIAFFQAKSLSFINYAEVPGQGNIGWCAVNKSGYLYSSIDDTDIIRSYEINWPRLLDTNHHDALNWLEDYPLTDISGAPLMLHNMQGGEFTSSGQLLYVSCGIFGTGGSRWPTDGLHVFDTSTWREIQRSFNSGFRFGEYPPYFKFSFDNTLEGGDEPEGLTVWDDLDDGRAPYVHGQLHVILYIHNYFHSNKVKLKHYTRKVYVNASAPPPPPRSEYDPPPLHGTPEEPFNTVGNAFNWYNPIWDGAEIVIKAGSYPETGTFSKRVRLVSEGGVAIIGE